MIKIFMFSKRLIFFLICSFEKIEFLSSAYFYEFLHFEIIFASLSSTTRSKNEEMKRIKPKAIIANIFNFYNK